MSFLAVPIGEAILGAGEALGVGEVLGAGDSIAAGYGLGAGKVSGAVKGAVGGGVIAASGVSSYVKQVENKISTAFNTANAFLKDLQAGSPFGTTYREGVKQQNLYNVTHPLTEAEGNALNARLAQLYIEQNKPKPAASGTTSNRNTTGPISGPTVRVNPVIIGSSFDVASDELGMGQVSGLMTLNPASLGQIPNIPVADAGFAKVDKQVPVNLDVKVLDKNAGKMLGQFIAESHWDSQHSDDSTSVVQLLVKKPEYASVANSYFNYTEFVKYTPGYQEVANVHNGRNMNVSNAFVDTNGHFALKDEVGTVETYYGRSAPVGSTIFYLLANGFLPAAPGTVWMGPKSPNNGLPLSLVDLFCMAHDIEYDMHGWFAKVGDLKLISRCSQNKDRMGFYERTLADVAIKWFSTVGYALAAITQGLPGDVDKVPVSMKSNDIYTFINQDNVLKNVPRMESYVEYGPEFLSKPLAVDPVLRSQFYAGVREGAEEIYSQKIKEAVGGGSGGGLFNLHAISLID